VEILVVETTSALYAIPRQTELLLGAAVIKVSIECILGTVAIVTPARLR